jgi:hypothetical protein
MSAVAGKGKIKSNFGIIPSTFVSEVPSDAGRTDNDASPWQIAPRGRVRNRQALSRGRGRGRPRGNATGTTELAAAAEMKLESNMRRPMFHRIASILVVTLTTPFALNP